MEGLLAFIILKEAPFGPVEEKLAALGASTLSAPEIKMLLPMSPLGVLIKKA